MVLRANFLLLSAAALLVCACTTKKDEKPPGPAQKPKVPVVVATVAQRTIPVQVRGIGNVEAYSTITVKSQVTGVLTKVLFNEGDYVKKDQLLFEIDPRQAQDQVRQLEANLAKDMAQLANARADAARFSELYKQGIIAKQQYEQYATTSTTWEAAVRADQAAIENARVQLEYNTIQSPIDGRTGTLLVKQGNLVKANDVALVVINQIRPIYVAFAVPEKELPAIKERLGLGLPVEANLGADDRGRAVGKLTFIENAVDTATGTIRLKGTFDNEQNQLWPGQFVNVVLTVSSQRDAILVPSQAVQSGQKGEYVYVVKPDMKVEYRTVTLGRAVDNDIAISSGLQPGETVVTDGQSRLTPGAQVEVVKNAPAGRGAPGKQGS